MKKILLVSGVFLLFSFNGSAQTNCGCFDKLYQLSNYYAMVGDSLMSINALRDAISFLDPSKQPEYFGDLASTFAYYKMVDSAKYYYTKAWIDGGLNPEDISDRYSDIFTQLDTVYIRKELQKRNQNIDLSLYRKFTDQLAVDQAIRSGLCFSEEEMFGKDSLKNKFINDVCYRVDSSTFEFVKWVLNTYGFPSYPKFSFLPDGFVAEMMHVTAYGKKQWDDYLYPKLDSLSLTGDYEWRSQLLFMQERQRTVAHKKTVAGYFGSRDRYSNIENAAVADSFRFKYNLLRIKEEAISYPKNQVPESYKPIPYPPNYFCLKKYQID